MDPGSNMGTVGKDGTKKNTTCRKCFQRGDRHFVLRFFAKQVNTTDRIQTVRLQSAGKGGKENWTLYDNVLVTLYRGTDHVAFAAKNDVDKGRQCRCYATTRSRPRMVATGRP